MSSITRPIPILHKTRVHGLALHVGRSGLCLNDTVHLHPADDGRLMVTASVRRHILGLIPHRRQVTLGHLGPRAATTLAPWLAAPDGLRLRIVGLTPEHLAGPEGAEVHVSVWGEPLPPPAYVPAPPLAGA
ncbi:MULTISPECIES: hypothetical protein [Gemmobacter]|jgi:hypothetical protein|uniref:Uncharacterized protein n=2 Tax=Gemmobacter TaxID=204456 RepID=A0A2T6B559_9RHOB|nr:MULTISPECIES: hypothetical protein [Gemmobacter]PTX51187.1 hypothetical protein C8N34_104307 [Gemmobacter caeni]TWJ01187.1 hypothetical protein IQ03_01904 [Gemmobacter caeni]GHC17717.1 hypothetical protein GCM10007291_15340 [Gemmobacter nanjingensis]